VPASFIDHLWITWADHAAAWRGDVSAYSVSVQHASRFVKVYDYALRKPVERTISRVEIERLILPAVTLRQLESRDGAYLAVRGAGHLGRWYGMEQARVIERGVVRDSKRRGVCEPYLEVLDAVIEGLDMAEKVSNGKARTNGRH
jgi:hypothetical protein